MGFSTALLLACVVSSLAASCQGLGNDVKEITVANFDAVIGAAPFALVEFYAPW